MPVELDSFVAVRSGASVKAAGARSCRWWHYATNHDWATVSAAAYFNPARTYIGVGDLVFISGDLDGTPFYRQLMFATVPAAGNVTWIELAVTPEE